MPQPPIDPARVSLSGWALRAAVPLLCILTSCQYIKDRSLDFIDQYNVKIGLGSTVGARGQSLGLVDTGLMMGVKPNAAALGWKYGQAFYFDNRDTRMNADQAEIIKTTHIVNLDYNHASYFSARNSAAVLPGLLTWTDSTPTEFEWLVPEEGEDFQDRSWLWSPYAIQNNRYAQVHAFDIELEVGLAVYMEVGYSPGELIDFLLGLITIDIAQDDGRF